MGAGREAEGAVWEAAVNPFRRNAKLVEELPATDRVNGGRIERQAHHCNPPSSEQCDSLGLRDGDRWICDCGKARNYYGAGVWSRE